MRQRQQAQEVRTTYYSYLILEWRSLEEVMMPQIANNVLELIGNTPLSRKDCLYCGLRKSNDQLIRYRMSLQEIFQKEELGTVLKVLALTRLVTRNTHNPATTAVGSLFPGGKQRALQCGANVIMPNATPNEFRQHYQIYPNKICLNESPQNCHFCIEAMVTSTGRKVAANFGHTVKNKTLPSLQG